MTIRLDDVSRRRDINAETCNIIYSSSQKYPLLIQHIYGKSAVIKAKCLVFRQRAGFIRPAALPTARAFPTPKFSRQIYELPRTPLIHFNSTTPDQKHLLPPPLSSPRLNCHFYPHLRSIPPRPLHILTYNGLCYDVRCGRQR
jgi:hypothetical protein